jgi:hypothetical protein
MRILGASVALLLAAAVPACASAATAQQTINILNVQRTANGIPAGITENATWSQDCAAHDNYMALNNLLTHTEAPGSSGYTTGGAFAGQNSVLAQGADWDNGNPYETAPLHLDQLLAPRLAVLGSADADGFTCTTTFPGWTRPAPVTPVIYTYPGDGASIYPAEKVHEVPFTPGTLVGMRPGAQTGPILIVLVDPTDPAVTCLSVKLSDASLTGPHGVVPVATVDGTAAVPGGGTLACYIAPGGFIIPEKHLAASATYHAHVLLTYDGATTSHDWTFTTTGLDPHAKLTLRGHTLRFSSRSRAPLHVTFTRATGRHAPKRTIAPGHGIRLQLPPGSWQACGVEPPTRGYAGFQQCVSFAVKGVPTLQFGQPRLIGAKVAFPLTFTPVLRGRDATLTITSETCSKQRCQPTKAGTTTQTVVLGPSSIQVPAPQPGYAVQLTLATDAFQLGDAPWVAATATSHLFRG